MYSPLRPSQRTAQTSGIKEVVVLCRILTVLVIAVAATLASATPSDASYPTITCSDANYASVYTSPDGEVWVCDYDVDWDDYFWVPLRPSTTPADAVVYKRQLVTDAQGIDYRIVSRLEWIGNRLYTGADFDMRSAPHAWYTVPTNNVAQKMRVYAYDSVAATWRICAETAWLGNFAPAVGMVSTTDWGNTPCGVRWYYSVGYVERLINGTWTLVTPGVATVGGTTLSGTTPSGSPSAVNGLIWDPKPGDTTKPPKPPKVPKKLEKHKLPKAGPPVPTTDIIAAF
jgi:hypothetical protein